MTSSSSSSSSSASALPVSHSIWNENPTVYYFCKRAYSVLVTPIYPLAHYCVLTKSPKSFGSLKWILYFHLICITAEWFANAFFLDMFEFQPSIVIRIDGFLNRMFDGVSLYIANTFFEQIASTSALYLFCSRLLLVANMYSPSFRSGKRLIFEVAVYLVVSFFGLWPIPAVILSIPDQNASKWEMITLQDERYYPDCLLDPSVVVVSAVNSDAEDFLAIWTIGNWISIAILLFLSAQVAFWLLSRRITGESESTKRMHRKFNRRTMLQAAVYISFSSIPFSVLYTTVFLHLYVPGLSFAIDIVSENHPTVCVLTFFAYYDPYQAYFLQLFKRNPVPNVAKTSGNAFEKSVVVRI